MKEFVYRRVNDKMKPENLRDLTVYDLETALDNRFLVVIRSPVEIRNAFSEAGGIKNSCKRHRI